MNQLFLVRHGQDTDNATHILNGRRNTELTDLGREQAYQVATKLKDKNISVIYSSPLKRTFETASIIAKELGINEVIKIDDLIEREFGILTGKPLSDITKYSKKNLLIDGVTYFLEVDGAEDFPALLERGKKVLAEIQARSLDKNILIVTHGDISKMIRAAYNNWTWEQGLQTPYLDNTGIIELK